MEEQREPENVSGDEEEKKEPESVDIQFFGEDSLGDDNKVSEKDDESEDTNEVIRRILQKKSNEEGSPDKLLTHPEAGSQDTKFKEEYIQRY